MWENLGIKPHAIMIAVPYQGHLNPFVHLALKLASNGFTITFVHTEHAHHMISKSHNTNNVEFDIFSEARNSGLDIRYTTIFDGFPLQYDRELNVVEYWEHMLYNFPDYVDELVGKLIESLDPSSVPLLVADTFACWPGKIAKKYSLVNVSFWTQPALALAVGYYLDLLRENGHFPPKENNEYALINYIPGVEPIRTKDLMSYFQETDTTTIVHKLIFMAFEEVKKADFIICNTVQELEPETLSTMNREHPTYAIGPVNFSIKTNISKSLLSEIDCTKWLDTKPPGSVLYVSFGSIVQTNKQIIEEIAKGLLLSEVNFIWAIRHNIVSSIDMTDVLTIEFKDNIKDRGLIVPWCNQNSVLSHSAIGGFLTHCGWNSILEGVWCGVPMICYPVMYDQPTNRKLVVDDWKIGINLCDGVSVNGDEVAVKIKRLMSRETPDCIKHEMQKVRSIVHNALAEDGSSERNFDQFLKDLRDKIIHALP
ncbi:hypothetical protein BUALT_Bualt09G0078500 [Buddleja alternifolia]|uniref:Glycosyltransferase n=1 Tax=Buddleja alternifolia TaxID=168488 RepID=A0AAV6X1D9_9LAMI|nr:hypothetical protein BUALT_Bualt09G0078500 [Buddleja alternifolia]